MVEAWACLGLALEAEGRWADAVAALARAIDGAGDAASATWCFSRGQCLMRLGRLREALAAFDRALAIDPGFAAAWSQRGGLLREMQRLDEAAQCFERALALGADPELHTYYLAAVRAGAAPPPAAPRHYVQALFDDYADEFQGHLVDKLGYRGHEVLLRPLLEGGRRFRSVLDLGCGTGLCGALLKPVSESIDGVDLSQRMLEQARRLGVYRELVQADIGEYLSALQRRVELVVAADVLNYVGELAGVLRDVARVLEPGGLFAFTLELPSDGDAELQLLPSLRYAHSPRYVRGLAAACGLQLDDERAAPIRHEQAAPVAGLYLRLRKPSDAR
jgi:predicted TPR repeat methyltransferase